MEVSPKKFHIAVFPWLAFGHISPFFELAKLIAQKGHKISFISTPRNIKRLSKLPPNLQPLVQFIELTLPHIENLPENAEATMDIPTHIVPYLKKAFDGLQQPLIEFLEKSNPDCFIYDFGPYWLPPILSKLGILSIYFSIYSAFGMSFVVELIVGKPTDDDNIISDVHHEQNESGVSDILRVKETVFGADFIAIRSCMEIEGVKVERNDEHDGKFTRDSVTKALRSVMVNEEGKCYRSNAKEMSKIVGDMELHQKYLDDFVDYVELQISASKH
ncbi:hypothetical protein TSUD_162510 [Trifolium subterraneum]|uniref:Glycosyltransferase N-terminal domain-containing protein n=1 Tax=Trifolium subterraneum TaxID=3900 RepID=A0A2Z6NVV0_TRISU|nr:hypothetical protein TSUD_162510 [Trifolium subterraneum]